MAVNPFVTPQVSRWVPALSNSSDVGFFQWKPVSYRQPEPVVEDATPCHHSHPLPQSGEAAAAASGLVRAFYTQPQVFGLNVSFGLAGEPFYNSTRFLSWWVSGGSWRGGSTGGLNLPLLPCRTLLVGVGSPPMDSISPLVVGMMAVGLGVPLLFVLLGTAFVCSRKKAVTTGYEPIN